MGFLGMGWGALLTEGHLEDVGTCPKQFTVMDYPPYAFLTSLQTTRRAEELESPAPGVQPKG